MHRILIDDSLVRVTPEIVAELFAHMDCDEQAVFFNEVANLATTWGTKPDNLGMFCFQLQYVTDSDKLKLSGRRVMQEIGNYSHWGLVPSLEDVQHGKI